jgi:hypothetical protein
VPRRFHIPDGEGGKQNYRTHWYYDAQSPNRDPCEWLKEQEQLARREGRMKDASDISKARKDPSLGCKQNSSSRNR